MWTCRGDGSWRPRIRLAAPRRRRRDSSYESPETGSRLRYKVGFIPASASSAAAGAEAAGGDVATAASIVREALDVGYRFLDCAQFYGNEKEVGDAIAAAGVARTDLYLASKCWSDAIYEGPAAVRAQVERSLRDLRTDYLDLYLVHWPVPGKHVDAYLELQKCRAEGLVRSIGVSNYAVEDVKELLEADGVDVVPAVNQIELNPFLYRKETLESFSRRADFPQTGRSDAAAAPWIFRGGESRRRRGRDVNIFGRDRRAPRYLASKGIAIQAYRALRDGKAFDDETLLAVAAKHGATTAQVLGRRSAR